MESGREDCTVPIISQGFLFSYIDLSDETSEKLVNQPLILYGRTYILTGKLIIEGFSRGVNRNLDIGVSEH
jgi:hypothetical protein